MAWTTPLTAIANTALTASQWNASVRDNLNETAPAKATTSGGIFVATGANAIAERIPTSASVETSETTTSASFTDLATVGPTVTVTTGTKAVVAVRGNINNNTAGSAAYMSYDISGATTASAGNTRTLAHTSSTAGAFLIASAVFLESSLTSGSNVFTAKYRTGSGGTGAFANRQLLVIPF